MLERSSKPSLSKTLLHNLEVLSGSHKILDTDVLANRHACPPPPPPWCVAFNWNDFIQPRYSLLIFPLSAEVLERSTFTSVFNLLTYNTWPSTPQNNMLDIIQKNAQESVQNLQIWHFEFAVFRIDTKQQQTTFSQLSLNVFFSTFCNLKSQLHSDSQFFEWIFK